MKRVSLSEELVSLILNESFEYGIDTKSDALVRDYMSVALASVCFSKRLL